MPEVTTVPEEQRQPVDFVGTVWVDKEQYIMFTVSAGDIQEARAIARARFGEDRHITMCVKGPDIDIRDEMGDRFLPGEHDPQKEYLGKLWVDGEPVRRFSLMARNGYEAWLLAEDKYGKHRMSIWNEEERHTPRQ